MIKEETKKCKIRAELEIDELFEKALYKEESIEEILKIFVQLREYIEDKEWDLELELEESKKE